MSKSNCGPGNNCGSNKLFYTEPFAEPPIPNPECTISGFHALNNLGTVEISWTTTTEVRVSIYILDRKLQSDPDYTTGVQIDFPTGESQPHTILDAPGAGNYTYRLRALFDDSTEIILGTQNITIP